ncbi:hypothetical protein OK016_17950 [Vibrio chagasii]|nr:hypothetical protein [Vibrio chagasii]
MKSRGSNGNASDSITELNTISNDNNASAQHCLIEVDKVAEQGMIWTKL